MLIERVLSLNRDAVSAFYSPGQLGFIFGYRITRLYSLAINNVVNMHMVAKKGQNTELQIKQEDQWKI